MIPCVGHKKHTSTTSTTKNFLNRFPPNNTTSPHKTNKQLQNSTFFARVFFVGKRSHPSAPVKTSSNIPGHYIDSIVRPYLGVKTGSPQRGKTYVETTLRKRGGQGVPSPSEFQAPQNEGTETYKIYNCYFRGGFSRIHKPKNIQLTSVRIPPF